MEKTAKIWGAAQAAIVLGARGVSPAVIVPAFLSGALFRETGYQVRTRALSKLLFELGYVRREKPVYWLCRPVRVWVKDDRINEYEIVKCLSETLKLT